MQRRYGPKLRDHWTALVQQDPVSLHACICVAASNSALAAGELPLTDPNKRRSSVLLLDTFHHRGETIKLVNEGLSDPIKASSDQLIAAVSILLTIEVSTAEPLCKRLANWSDCIWQCRLSQNPSGRSPTDGRHEENLRGCTARRSIPDIMVSLTQALVESVGRD